MLKIEKEQKYDIREFMANTHFGFCIYDISHNCRSLA
jgi:hypothetical protein